MKTELAQIESKLTDAEGLLAALWAEAGRPSLRWLRGQQQKRTIPFLKVGRLVFFDPEKVKKALIQLEVQNR